MYEYDEEVLNTFLENQTQLFSEEVADSPETAEEFLEFVAWGKDRDYYKSKLDKELSKREMLAKKTCWAIDADPKKPGKVKIIDQEHAAELLEMAKDYLA